MGSGGVAPSHLRNAQSTARNAVDRRADFGHTLYQVLVAGLLSSGRRILAASIYTHTGSRMGLASVFGAAIYRLASTLANRFPAAAATIPCLHLALQSPDIDERLTGCLPSTISHPNLRSLNLHCNWTSAWILETVASCPKLDKLALRIELYDKDRNYDDPFLHADQVYRHTNLRDLRLEGYPAWDGRYDLIVRQLALPSLVELDIKLDERSTSFLAIKYLQSDIEITAHISDSWKHLRVFRLRGPYRISDQYKEDVNFETICSIIHSVTHLTPSKIDFDTESILLRGLGHLPHLKTLELLGVSPNLHYDALLAFIQERQSQDPEFKFIFNSA